MEPPNTVSQLGQEPAPACSDALVELIRANNPQKFREYLKMYPSVVNMPDSTGHLPLVHCLRRSNDTGAVGGPARNLAFFRWMLRNGAQPNVDINGKPFLVFLARRLADKMITVLLSAGAHVNVQDPATGDTPLHAYLKACLTSKFQISGLSIFKSHNARVDIANNAGLTAPSVATGCCLKHLVRIFPETLDQLNSARVFRDIKQNIFQSSTSVDDIRYAITFLNDFDLDDLLFFVLSRWQTIQKHHLFQPIDEAIERAVTSGKSVAERLQALKQPESGEHFLFTILKQIRGRPQMSAPIIDGFFALFHHYGFDFSSSCMKDIDGKSFSEVLAEHRLYPQLVTTTALLLQTGHCALPDPTFLPNFLKHHISQLNGSRTAKATESTVETGTFPLKAHLLELPGDIVREILVHCQYSDIAALILSCRLLNRTITQDAQIWLSYIRDQMPHVLLANEKNRIDASPKRDASSLKSAVVAAAGRASRFLKTSLRTRIVDTSIRSSYSSPEFMSLRHNELFVRAGTRAQVLDIGCGKEARVLHEYDTKSYQWYSWSAYLSDYRALYSWHNRGDQHIGVRASKLLFYPPSLAQPLPLQSLNPGDSKMHSFSFPAEASAGSGSVSRDETKLLLSPGLLIDLQAEKLIQRFETCGGPRISGRTLATAASLFNDYVFATSSGQETSIFDTRAPTPSSSFMKPSIHIRLDNGFGTPSITFRDENKLWSVYNKFSEIDLRMQRATTSFSHIPTVHEHHVANMDPLESRLCTVTYGVQWAPLIWKWDLSGPEPVSSVQLFDAAHPSWMAFSLTTTQFITVGNAGPRAAVPELSRVHVIDF